MSSTHWLAQKRQSLTPLKPTQLTNIVNNNNSNSATTTKTTTNNNDSQIDGLAPTFQKKPSIKHENDGRRLVFECVVLANPQPTIKWFYNGQAVDEPSARFSARVVRDDKPNTFRGLLEVSSVSIEDAGKYKVVARNELGESQASISLNFDSDEKSLAPGAGAGIKPTFVEKPTISQAPDLRSIKFECKLIAEPRPEIVWLHKGVELDTRTGSSPFRASLVPTPLAGANQWLAVLTLNSIDAKLGGDYKCVASNVAGKSQASINLNFDQGKPKIPDGRAPKFPRKPVIRQAGANLVLECVLEAKPRPTISWFHSGEPIGEDARHKFSIRGPLSSDAELKPLGLDAAGDDSFGPAANLSTIAAARRASMVASQKREIYVVSLEIRAPKAADGGSYRCNALNELGESNANISLNFQQKEQQKDDNKENKQQDDAKRMSQASEASAAELGELAQLAKQLDASLDKQRRLSSSTTSAAAKRPSDASQAGSRRASKQLAGEGGVATTTSDSKPASRRASALSTASSQATTKAADSTETPMEVDGGAQEAQARRPSTKRTVSVKKRSSLAPSEPSASDLAAPGDGSEPKRVVKKKVSVKRPESGLKDIGEQQQIPAVSISVESPSAAGTAPLPPQAQSQAPTTKDRRRSSGAQQQATTRPKLSVSEAPNEPATADSRRGAYDKLRGDSNDSATDAEEAEAARRYLAGRGGGDRARDSLSPAGLRAPGGRDSSPLNSRGSSPSEGQPQGRRGSILLLPDGGDGAAGRRPSLIVPDDNKLRPGEIADRRRRSSIDVRRASVLEVEAADRQSTPLRPVGKKPQIIDFQDNISGTENHTSYLTFGLEGDPVPTLRFFKGDSEIFEGGRYSVVTDGETNTVHFCIRKSKPMDEARYRIMAINEHGEDSAYMQLFVSDESGMDFRAMLKHRQYAKWKKDQDDPNWGNLKSVEEERLAQIKEPKRPDNFLKPIQNQRIKQGKDLKVRFESIFSKSGVKAKWFRNNKEIFPNKKFHLISTGDLHVLEIDAPYIEDAGRYTIQCLDTKCSAILEVDEPDPVYKFTKVLAKGYGQHLNRELVLECTANSHKAQVQWYKNDRRCQNPGALIVPDNVKYVVEHDKFGKKILRIKQCTFDDSADYSCKIINTPRDDEITSTQAQITEKKFQIVKPLYSQRATEDDKLVLECEVDELDAPVKWYRKDRATGQWKELKPEQLKSKQIIVEGKKRRLIIKKAKCNDEGEYKCCTNGDETAAELFIEPSNKWRKKLIDVTIVEGEPLLLEVELMERKPGASLKWIRNGRELGTQGGGGVAPTTADERAILKLVDDKYTMLINEAKLDDAGDWIAECGRLRCACRVQVLPGEKAPVASFPMTTVHADVGKQTVIEVPYKVAGTKVSPVNAQVLLKGVPVPRDKVEVVVRDDKVVLRFKDPQTADSSDQYTFVLENAKGKSAHKFKLDVQGPPGTPQGPLRATDIAKDRCTLHWERPLDDGGAPIAHYVVEKQEAGGRWVECGITSTTKLDVKDLNAKKEYKFRVRAVNKKGKSEPLTSAKSIIAKDPYDPPGEPENLTIVNWDKNFADLAWDVPANDGGVPIEGYLIEAKSKFESDWHEVQRLDVGQGTKAHVVNGEHLKENAQVQFRVKAINKAGPGQPSKATKPIVLKARFVRPHLFGDGLKNLVVKKGRPIRYEINFGGEPAPEVIWIANESQLNNTPGRIEIDSSIPKKTTLIVTNTTRADSGRYKIVLRNSSGEVTSEADVVVLDRPAAPEGPLIMEEIKVDQVTIKWRKPKDNGGGDGLDGYVVEKMNLETGRWIPAGETGPNDESFTVKGLMKGKKYKFRVRAKNKEGESDPLETANVLDVGEEPTIGKCPPAVTVGEGSSTRVKIPFSGEPAEFKLTNLDTGEVVCQVSGDGTNASTGGPGNVKLTVLDDYLSLSVNDAKMANKGRYKLELKNKQGTDSAEFDLNVTGKPGAPQGPLEVNDVTESSATLSWRPPADDGGSKVSHYIVERRDASRGDDAWIEVAPNCVSTSFTVPNLTKDTAYKFRVMAVNENGTSKPLETDVDVVAKLPYDKPSAPGAPEVTAVGEDFVSLEWQRPASDGGSRITGYLVEKREVGSDTWQRVNLEGGSPCLTTQATVKALVEDRKYEFRVIAQNAAGNSDPSECSAQTLIKDPNANELPQFVEGLKRAVGVEGGTIEMQCVVSGNPSPSVVWTKGDGKELRDGGKYRITQEDGPNNTTIHKLVIQRVTGEDADEYQAKASNKAGSRTTRADAVVKTKPRIQLPPRLASAAATDGSAIPIQFDRGESVQLKVPFTGNPPPTVRWFKGDEEIEPSAQFDIETDDRHTTLTIRDATREDSGDYRLVVENELGSDSATIGVSVSDRPEPPRFPMLESVCEDAATLSWKPPLWDGGSSITQYVIEKRELPMTSWIKAATTRFLSHQVVNLNEDKDYEFRVFAENIYGRSEPSDIVRTTTKPSKRERRRTEWPLDKDGNKMRSTVGNLEPIDDYDKFVKDQPAIHTAADIKTTPITDNYEIYEKIGVGVFGEVYRVKEKATGEFYAAKFTKTSTNEEKSLIRKEIDTINCLHHTNLLRLHDAYEDDDEMVTVHEFISGSEVLEKVATPGYAMTEEQVKKYMRDVCEGVRHMHDRNVIHLDLKPENLMLQSQKPLFTDHEPKVKIIDFGMACKLDPHEICKISTTAVDYAAPEILEKDTIGFYTDMWAIGALTYALMCGEPPFGGSHADIKDGKWSFDQNAAVFDKVSAEGKDFIEKLLVRQKEKRMTAHECLEHPWLRDDGDEQTRRKRREPLVDGSAYRRERDAMRKRYLDWWDKSIVPIGHISNYGPLRKLYADRYKIHDALVDRRELAPRFVIKPMSTFAYESQSANFYCMISSNSPFTISWFKDNKELKQSVKYMKRYTFDNDFTFVVNRCKLSDLGEYVIRAENHHGARDEPVFLNVQPRPVDFTPVRLEPYRKHREPTPPKFEEEPDCAPSFNFRLRPRTIQAGLPVKLLCCVKGKPTPVVTWFKDGRELSKRDYTINHRDGVATLEIDPCTPSHSGKYTCNARNSLGDDESTADVLVEPKRTFTPAPMSSYMPASYSPPKPMESGFRTHRSASLTRALSPSAELGASSLSYLSTATRHHQNHLRAQTPDPTSDRINLSPNTLTLYNSSYSIKTNRYLRRSYKFDSAAGYTAARTTSRFARPATRIPAARLPARTMSTFGRSVSSMGL